MSSTPNPAPSVNDLNAAANALFYIPSQNGVDAGVNPVNTTFGEPILHAINFDITNTGHSNGGDATDFFDGIALGSAGLNSATASALDFITLIKTYSGAGNDSTFANLTPDQKRIQSNTYQALLNAYCNLLGLPSPYIAALGVGIILNPNNTNLGDWNDLLSEVPLTAAEKTAGITTPSSEDIDNFIINSFESTFGKFLNDFPFKSPASGSSSGSTGTQPADFIQSWYNYLAVNSSLTSDTTNANSYTPTNPNAPVSTGLGQNLTSYQALYDAFMGTDNGFSSAMQDYYNEVVQQNGYFVPSQFLPGWLSKIQTAAQLQSGNASPIAGTDSAKLSVLFQILALLAGMTQTLQKTALAQAKRLTVYANIQKDYTYLIGVVPNVTRDNMKSYINDSDSNITTLASTISAINSNYTENLKNYRQLYTDQSQQQQTAVNQSNETVNQQADLFTSLIQQQGTLLQSIFHG